MVEPVKWAPVEESPAPRDSDWGKAWKVSVTELLPDRAITTTYEATNGISGTGGETRIVWEELVCRFQREGVEEVENQSGDLVVERIESKQGFLRVVKDHYEERREEETEAEELDHMDVRFD